ncbi:ParG [Scytonema sp. UIC 10036]|uniref:plasmid partition protein ParG n=1 Tax=Scytonema sp. UIC 10036 TaxID=2304196 RepID=UPI0012DA814F|nr:plasmid partition protein ParG [Scytonema sp. UIC 10036]MUH00636.1 ParG [Scytonema sp. UIC 10036]
MAEEEKPVRVSIYLSEDVRARFKSACALHKKSMNEVLVEFIEEYLNENEQPTPKLKKSKGAA